MNRLTSVFVVLSLMGCGSPAEVPWEAGPAVLAGTVDGAAWWPLGPPVVTREGGALSLAGESLGGVRISLVVRMQSGVTRYGQGEIAASLSRSAATRGRDMHWPSTTEGELVLDTAAPGIAGRFRVVLVPDAWTLSQGGRLTVLEGRFSGP